MASKAKEPSGLTAAASGGKGSELTLQNSKDFSEILSRIQENLSKSLSKNDNLLEAIESSEVRATQTGSNEVRHCYNPEGLI